MYDISTVNKRYFDIKFSVTQDGKERMISLQVEPPKVKTLKKLISVSKMSQNESVEALSQVLQKLLSGNKSGYKVPIEYIDELDFDQLQDILKAYFEWVSDLKKDPN